jgi:hypothetical protein
MFFSNNFCFAIVIYSLYTQIQKKKKHFLEQFFLSFYNCGQRRRVFCCLLSSFSCMPFSSNVNNPSINHTQQEERLRAQVSISLFNHRSFFLSVFLVFTDLFLQICSYRPESISRWWRYRTHFKTIVSV